MLHNKAAIAIGLFLAFLIAIYSFIFGLENFIDEFDYPGIPPKLDIWWKAAIINSLVLGATLLILYGISLANLLFRKVLPAKLVICICYINIIVALFYFSLIVLLNRKLDFFRVSDFCDSAPHELFC